MSSKSVLLKTPPISLEPMIAPVGSIFFLENKYPPIEFKFGSDSEEIGLLRKKVRKISLYIHMKIRVEGLSEKVCDDILRKLVGSYYEYKEVFKVVLESNFLGENYFAFYFKGKNLFGEAV